MSLLADEDVSAHSSELKIQQVTNLDNISQVPSSPNIPVFPEVLARSSSPREPVVSVSNCVCW